MNTSFGTAELDSDGVGGNAKPPTIVFACSECWYLGTKRCPICPSCSSINTLQVAAPELSDLYFKRVRKLPDFSTAIFKSRENDDDDARGFGAEMLDPDEADEPDQSPRNEDQDEDEDENEDEDEDEDEPVEAAEVATVASFKGEGIVRIPSSDKGVDHVFSGGIPKNHAFMLAASPGGGKSTLCRQLAAGMAELGSKVMIAAGEEVGAIANDEFKRLQLFKRFPKGAKKVLYSGSDDTDAVIAAAHQNKVDVLIVDSLSILSSSRVQGPPGKEKQVNYAAYHLMQAAHGSNEYEGHRPFTVIMISHVTKDGSMAGPNAAKHWTDGAFIIEHIDPRTLEPADDQNKPTGYVKLRVLGKYRRGSSMNSAYYHFTETGLHPWTPGDPIEEPKRPSAASTSAVEAKPQKKTKTTKAKPAAKIKKISTAKPEAITSKTKAAKSKAPKKPAARTKDRASAQATSARKPRPRS